MKKRQNPVRSQHLAKAEALFTDAATKYVKYGVQHIDALVELCTHLTALKAAFTEMRMADRPERTWEVYASQVARNCGLRFKGTRSVDLYIELGADMAAVGIDRIKEHVLGGTIKEVRAAITLLDPPLTTPKPPISAHTWLKRALKGIENAEADMPQLLRAQVSEVKRHLNDLLDRLHPVAGREHKSPAATPVWKPFRYAPAMVQQMLDQKRKRTALITMSGKAEGCADV